MNIKNTNIQDIAADYILEKSPKNFKILYDRIRPGLYNLCIKILRDPDLAEDAVANAFLKIWTKIYQYTEDTAKFSTWSYNIAKNECLAIIKQRKKYMPEGAVPIDHLHYLENSDGKSHTFTQDPEWAFDEKMSLENSYNLVIDELYNLPELYKDIMIDREINGMKYKDIAVKYEIKRKSVATRIRRARTKIKKIFPGYLVSDETNEI